MVMTCINLLKDATAGFFASILFVACCMMPFWGIDLAMHVLGKFVNGLVVFSAKDRIKLPSGTLCRNIWFV